METPGTVGTPELRRIFRCDRKTVLRWIRLGQLPAERGPRGSWRVRIDAVAKMRKSHGTRRKGYGPFGPRHGGDWYTRSERELLRSDLPSAEVASRIGRTVKAVQIQRCRMRAGKTRDREIARRTVAEQSGASGAWFITPHAVERYRQRVDQNASARQALEALIRLSVASVGERPRKLQSGAVEYDLDDIRCVVQRPKNGRKLPVLVTVKTRLPCIP